MKLKKVIFIEYQLFNTCQNFSHTALNIKLEKNEGTHGHNIIKKIIIIFLSQ